MATHRKRVLNVTVAILAVTVPAAAARVRQTLADGWYVKQLESANPDIGQLVRSLNQPDKAWLSARMPAQVHEILLAHKLIPDPRLSENAAKVTWVSQKDWAYGTKFRTPAGATGPVFLHLDGLDTLATVYLNGVELLSPDLQLKLLHVLEDQEVRPVGGTQGIKIDLLVISSSNLDLKDLVKAGQFREDLYQRLKVVTLKIPSLRERKEDLAILSRYFIQRYAKEFGKTIKDIDPESLDTFNNYDWPGNVRELRAILERAVLIASEEVIRPKHLPPLFASL